jgi:hypothetical protein
MLRFFHPLLFYPLVLLVIGLIVIFGLEPQKWPRAPGPVAGIVQNGVLVLRRGAFDTPDRSPEQQLTVMRDFWGRPQTLRIAVLPNQPPPTPAEQGVRILLTPDAAALIGDRPAVVDIVYRPLPLNSASALAVSLQGIGPADWVTQALPPQPARLSFTLPAQSAVNAIGLRAITDQTDKAYGLEITEMRVRPAP